MTTPASLVGLGMATVDIIVETPRLPALDDVYAVNGLTLDGGGPVTNALATFAKLGGSARYLGATATDHWGDEIRRGLHDAGVAVGEQVAPGLSSVSVILVDAATGSRSILYRPSEGTATPLAPADRASIAQAKILHLDGSNLAAALDAAREARRHGVLVSLDGGAGPLWTGVEELLPLVDVLIVAREFASQVTGESDPQAAGEHLRALGAQVTVITDGANGAWSWHEGGHAHQPAFPVRAVDTTAAGDVFHGAYLHALAGGQAPRQALTYASAAAALKCTRRGGRVAAPSLAEVQRLLATSPTK